MPGVLLLRFSSLGDVVLATAAARALKRRDPQAKVVLATKAAFAPLLATAPDVLGSFSLIGPAPGISVIKPDVQAPGVRILAAINNRTLPDGDGNPVPPRGADAAGMLDGTSMATMQKIEMDVGTSTVPLARITPPSTAAQPNTRLLHSMMCSSVCASSITGSLVMNSAIRWRENK